MAQNRYIIWDYLLISPCCCNVKSVIFEQMLRITVLMTEIAPRRLEYSATRWFAQRLLKTIINENIKFPHYWPFVKCLSTKGTNKENVIKSWRRHHGAKYERLHAMEYNAFSNTIWVTFYIYIYILITLWTPTVLIKILSINYVLLEMHL